MNGSSIKRRMVEHLVSLQGQKVFVLCVRYNYRGILAEVLEDGILLANATAVEQMGKANQEKPDIEDEIGSTVAISLDAVEIVFQPQCCFAPLPGEEVAAARR